MEGLSTLGTKKQLRSRLRQHLQTNPSSNYKATDWILLPDPKTGKMYYANLKTKQTRWDPPPGYSAAKQAIKSSLDSAQISNNYHQHLNAIKTHTIKIKLQSNKREIRLVKRIADFLITAKNFRFY